MTANGPLARMSGRNQVVAMTRVSYAIEDLKVRTQHGSKRGRSKLSEPCFNPHRFRTLRTLLAARFYSFKNLLCGVLQCVSYHEFLEYLLIVDLFTTVKGRQGF